MKKTVIAVFILIICITVIDFFAQNIISENNRNIVREHHRSEKAKVPFEKDNNKFNWTFNDKNLSPKDDLKGDENNFDYRKTTEPKENNLQSRNNQKSEADFGPYMSKIQKDIKKNWNPPKGNESAQVVVLFSIYKDGHVGKDIKILKSSGKKTVDIAATDAIQKTSPFEPLPQQFSGEKVDIQFSFDYNVYGASNK